MWCIRVIKNLFYYIQYIMYFQVKPGTTFRVGFFSGMMITLLSVIIISGKQTIFKHSLNIRFTVSLHALVYLFIQHIMNPHSYMNRSSSALCALAMLKFS